MAKRSPVKRGAWQEAPVKEHKSAPMSKEARAAYREVQRGVDHLGRSIKEIRLGYGRLSGGSRRMPGTIRALRAEVRTQLAELQSRQREAVRRLRRLAVAAGGSWQDIKQAADAYWRTRARWQTPWSPGSSRRSRSRPLDLLRKVAPSRREAGSRQHRAAGARTAGARGTRAARAGRAGPGLPAAPARAAGDGHPVLVLPGLMASDFSTRALRSFLRARGYTRTGGSSVATSVRRRSAPPAWLRGWRSCMRRTAGA